MAERFEIQVLVLSTLQVYFSLGVEPGKLKKHVLGPFVKLMSTVGNTLMSVIETSLGPEIYMQLSSQSQNEIMIQKELTDAHVRSVFLVEFL